MSWCPTSLASGRSRSRSSTLIADVAGEPRAARAASPGGPRPWAAPARTSPGCRRGRRTGVGRDGSAWSSSASVTPIEEKLSCTSSRPPGGSRSAQCEVAHGAQHVVLAVDEDQVDRPAPGVEHRRAALGQVLDPLADARPREVVLEDLPGGRSAELPARLERVDRDDGDVGPRERQGQRRAALVRADLDDGRAARQRAHRLEQHPGLVAGQPAADRLDPRVGGVEGRRGEAPVFNALGFRDDSPTPSLARRSGPSLLNLLAPLGRARKLARPSARTANIERVGA